jgi:hypothetical protein
LDSNHFVAALGFQRRRYDAMLEIMLPVPERRLAWRTVSNGHAPDHLVLAGVVSFESSNDKATCVTLKLTSSLGGAVSSRVDKYLHDFQKWLKRDR